MTDGLSPTFLGLDLERISCMTAWKLTRSFRGHAKFRFLYLTPTPNSFFYMTLSLPLGVKADAIS